MNNNNLSSIEKKILKLCTYVALLVITLSIFYNPLFGIGLFILFLGPAICDVFFWPRLTTFVVIKGWVARVLSLIAFFISIYIFLHGLENYNYIKTTFNNLDLMLLVSWLLFIPYIFYVIHNIEKILKDTKK